jgi:DNA repair protein RadC
MSTEQLLGLFGELAPLAVCEQPAHRIETFGAAALSDSELVAMLLQGTMSAGSALELARRLINDAGSLNALAKWTVEDYATHGIGRIKALQLTALPEVARRMSDQYAAEGALFNSADKIADYFRPMTIGLQVEKFWVASLNRKNRLIRCVEITSGTATSTLAHPREVFRTAIRASASGVVCAHNHPSGDPMPSAPDTHITRMLRDAAKAVDIQMIDHLIIGRPASDPIGKGYFSYREAGLL